MPIHLQQDNISDALNLYQASLKTREQILNNYGQSEQRLHAFPQFAQAIIKEHEC
ncbi:hypothetical protein [Nitrosomonas aestuarii]|uniref:hypothetical protein n=1 Tax=Nitrosomonas aestuarii TaxID=52441 RepID=UPI0015E6DB83|nr:hypothetical protein [Nitrosomonas aestuarii]